MKQKSHRLMLFVFLLAILVFLTGFTPLSAKPIALPDLVIVKVYADQSCNVVVVVRNNGPGSLPDVVYTNHEPKSAGVYITVNGKKWGGETIWKFDPAKKLQKPGGIATCTLNYKITTPVKVRADVDVWNVVAEKNEHNNKHVTPKLGCGTGTITPIKLPDLIVRKISLVKNCKIEVTLQNIGSAGVPDSFYNLPKAVGVQMYMDNKPWGGIILSGFDPTGQLKSPGGIVSHVWFPLAANLDLPAGSHVIKVEVDNNSVLTEANEGNNSRIEKVKCKTLGITPGLTVTPVGGVKPGILTPAPQRFFIDFKDAYLHYTIASKSIQVIAETNVLSYGSDWEKCQLKPYLFHIRQKVWQGFYWKINTDRKEVYKVTGGKFCELGGTEQKLNMSVDVRGDYFMLRFPQAYLVYVPVSQTLQVVTELMVLSYGNDWQKCNLNNSTYHLKENVWSAFYWKIDTANQKVYRVKGGTFCNAGGSEAPLNATLRVVK